MTQKLIIMDDEMGGKSKKESKHLKELTSKQVFTLREPYGRMNVDLHRLAVLCGTTNDLEILNDLHNRRQIPIEVHGIDHDSYNAICKRTLLMEAWHLYQNGFNWQVGAEDMKRLESRTAKFLEVFSEGELLDQYFMPGEIFMSTTEIKNRLEILSVQKLSLKRMGMELKRRFKRVVKGKIYGYEVREIGSGGFTAPLFNEPDPF